MTQRAGLSFSYTGIVVGLAMTMACATNPATGKREFNLMSEAQEIALGKESDGQIRKEMGIVDDQALQQYVDGVGQRLAASTERPALPWTFTVVDAPAVNAFALPGGYVYVTRGILAHLNSEAELAGVLGHEIAHVTARHSAAQYSKQTAGSLGLLLGQIFVPELRPFGQAAEAGLGLMFLKFGRDDELQADDLGAGYATSQGWDPRGVASMLETLGRLSDGPDRKGVPNWMSTHPMPADRVARLERAGRGAADAGHPRAGRESRRLPAARRRPDVWRQPARGGAAGQCVPASGAAVQARVPAGVAGPEFAAAGRGAAAAGRRLCLPAARPAGAGALTGGRRRGRPRTDGAAVGRRRRDAGQRTAGLRRHVPRADAEHGRRRPPLGLDQSRQPGVPIGWPDVCQRLPTTAAAGRRERPLVPAAQCR